MTKASTSVHRRPINFLDGKHLLATKQSCQAIRIPRKKNVIHFYARLAGAQRTSTSSKIDAITSRSTRRGCDHDSTTAHYQHNGVPIVPPRSPWHTRPHASRGETLNWGDTPPHGHGSTFWLPAGRGTIPPPQFPFSTHSHAVRPWPRTVDKGCSRSTNEVRQACLSQSPWWGTGWAVGRRARHGAREVIWRSSSFLESPKFASRRACSAVIAGHGKSSPKFPATVIDSPRRRHRSPPTYGRARPRPSRRSSGRIQSSSDARCVPASNPELYFVCARCTSRIQLDGRGIRRLLVPQTQRYNSPTSSTAPDAGSAKTG